METAKRCVKSVQSYQQRHQRHRRRSGMFIAKFEQIPHMKWCFYC